MRKLRTWVVLATVGVLGTAGVAVAHQKEERTHTDSVAATLAGTQSGERTKTCTGSDGAYREFHTKWNGTSTGDPRLSGELRVRLHGLVNTGTERGQVGGQLSIRGTNGKLAHGKLVGVYRAGKVHGTVIGRVKDRSTGAAEEVSGSGRLIGQVELTLAGNQLTGRIGGSEATILPAVIQQGGCSKGHHDRKRKRNR